MLLKCYKRTRVNVSNYNFYTSIISNALFNVCEIWYPKRNSKPVINFAKDRRQIMNASLYCILHFPFFISFHFDENIRAHSIHTVAFVVNNFTFVIYRFMAFNTWWMLPFSWLDFFRFHLSLLLKIEAKKCELRKKNN